MAQMKIGKSVQDLRESQIAILAGVLAAAFKPYPLAIWLLGPDHCSEQALGRLFQILFALPARRKFQFETAGFDEGVAVWIASESLPLFTASEGKNALRCFRKQFGAKVVRRLLQFHLASERHHSKVEHDYLFLLGIRPDAQHRGLGRRLLQDHLVRATELKRVMILETSSLENVAFYRRTGFELVGQYHLPEGGPISWIMERRCPPSRG